MKAPTQSAPVERNEINRKVTERAGGSNSVTQSQQCGCPNLCLALAHLDIVRASASRRQQNQNHLSKTTPLARTQPRSLRVLKPEPVLNKAICVTR